MKTKGMLAVTCCLVIALMATSGCARQKELERINRSQAQTIMSLNTEVDSLNSELTDLSRSREQLAKTQLLLQKRLKEELTKGDLQVSMQDKGLVVTVLNKILFDSGQTSLKKTAVSTLDKVGAVLKKEAAAHVIYVEGHTDTDPIKHSGFKSNWELSTARATEVVHFFVDKTGVNPERLVALGYGEFHPIASNASVKGKAQNRRVEIVISPKKFIKKPFSGHVQREQ